MSTQTVETLHDEEGQYESTSEDEKYELLDDHEQNLPTRHAASFRDNFVTLQWILVNMFSTVAVVFMNKIVFSDPQLKKCQLMIAAFHFITTAIVLYLASTIGMLTAVRVPIRALIPISCFFAGFLILGNLSLTFNTMGFYQLAKIMTTPTVVLLNFILFGITITRWSFLAVVVTCIGVLCVCTTSYADNVLGTMIAIAAFTVTALYQIWIGKKIQDLNITGSQLLLNQAPVAAGLLLMLAPFIDVFPDLSTVPSDTMQMLLLSGFLASMLNLSQYLIIERSNALTFNVISQVKTVIIVSLSWYTEAKQLTMLDLIGACLTIGGAYTYSVLCAKK